MNAPFKNSIAALVPELTEWRRDFHTHPELLYDCRRTAGLVAERLRACGFDEVHEGIGKTGVVGLLHGAKGEAMNAAKRVLLRADMDALPIVEATGDGLRFAEPRQDARLRPRRPHHVAAGRGEAPRRNPRFSTGRWCSVFSRRRKAARARTR